MAAIAPQAAISNEARHLFGFPPRRREQGE
jgi:hypothetical protein